MTWIDNLTLEQARTSLRGQIKKTEKAQRTIDKHNATISGLRKELSKAEAGDRTPGEFIYVDFEDRWAGFKPSCSKHGQMLAMDSGRGIWRCPTCHIGISTHNILKYIREEWDGVLIVK